MSEEDVKPEPTENKLGRLAFAYCKIATFSLLAGRYTLPLAAFLSAMFFLVSYSKGKKDTKCYLRYPLLAATFWIIVLVVWVLIQVFPDNVPPWIKFLHH